MLDQDTIAAVNEYARILVNAEVPEDEALLQPGHRCDMSRVGLIRRKFEVAAAMYKRETGLDVYDAIKRHEAWLRSPENAPQLYR